MKTVLNWLLSAVAVLIAAYVMPGVEISGFFAALVVAVVLALVNIIIRPIVLFLTLPINILTLGLFTLVINALMVMLASWFVPGFEIAGFWTAFFFSIILALINALFSIGERD